MKIANRKLTILIALMIVSMVAGVSVNQRSAAGSSSEPASNVVESASLDSSSDYRAKLVTRPDVLRAGETATLAITIEDKSGKQVRDLKVVHEKPMHLLLISSDLAEFAHVHPEAQPDGSFSVSHTFPNGGDYVLYVDFTPQGASQVVSRINVRVAGTERIRAELVEAESPTITANGLRVAMSSANPLRAGSEVLLNFEVSDAATGKPVQNLEQYLGAPAHFVIVSQDLAEFLHVHPMEEGAAMADHGAMKMPRGKKASTGATNISAHTVFLKAGLYKLWAQFKRAGRVITVPFVVRVGESATGGSASSDAIKITVTASGFEPARISVKKGDTVRLAFYRPDARGCGNEVVFPSLKIRKALPVGETTVVEFKASEGGDLSFACGMGMLRGTVVVGN